MLLLKSPVVIFDLPAHDGRIVLLPKLYLGPKILAYTEEREACVTRINITKKLLVV